MCCGEQAQKRKTAHLLDLKSVRGMTRAWRRQSRRRRASSKLTLEKKKKTPGLAIDLRGGFKIDSEQIIFLRGKQGVGYAGHVRSKIRLSRSYVEPRRHGCTPTWRPAGLGRRSGGDALRVTLAFSPSAPTCQLLVLLKQLNSNIKHDAILRFKKKGGGGRVLRTAGINWIGLGFIT